jgi:hypothetical protein
VSTCNESLEVSWRSCDILLTWSTSRSVRLVLACEAGTSCRHGMQHRLKWPRSFRDGGMVTVSIRYIMSSIPCKTWWNKRSIGQTKFRSVNECSQEIKRVRQETSDSQDIQWNCAVGTLNQRYHVITSQHMRTHANTYSIHETALQEYHCWSQRTNSGVDHWTNQYELSRSRIVDVAVLLLLLLSFLHNQSTIPRRMIAFGPRCVLRSHCGLEGQTSFIGIRSHGGDPPSTIRTSLVLLFNSE